MTDILKKKNEDPLSVILMSCLLTF